MSITFEQMYPKVRPLLLNEARLKRLKLSQDDLEDEKNGWKKLSRALYGTDSNAEDLKRLNNGRSCPVDAYRYIDFLLFLAQVVEVRDPEVKREFQEIQGTIERLFPREIGLPEPEKKRVVAKEESPPEKDNRPKEPDKKANIKTSPIRVKKEIDDKKIRQLEEDL